MSKQVFLVKYASKSDTRWVEILEGASEDMKQIAAHYTLCLEAEPEHITVATLGEADGFWERSGMVNWEAKAQEVFRAGDITDAEWEQYYEDCPLPESVTVWDCEPWYGDDEDEYDDGEYITPEMAEEIRNDDSKEADLMKFYI